MDSKFDLITNQLKNLKEEMQNVKKITETREIVDPLSQRIEKLETHHETLQRNVEEIREENIRLEKQIEYIEKYSRKNNVIISGIPQKEKENPRNIVKELTKYLLIEIQDYDIAAAHRLPTKTGIPHYREIQQK